MAQEETPKVNSAEEEKLAAVEAATTPEELARALGEGQQISAEEFEQVKEFVANILKQRLEK